MSHGIILDIAGKTAPYALAGLSIGANYIRYRKGYITGKKLAINTGVTAVATGVTIGVSSVATPVVGIPAGMLIELTAGGVEFGIAHPQMAAKLIPHNYGF